MSLVHRLFNRPETDIVPLGDLDKVLREKECALCYSDMCGRGFRVLVCEHGDVSMDLELLLDGLSELPDPGLDAVRKLTVVFVQVPQQAGQRFCVTRTKLPGHPPTIVQPPPKSNRY